MKNSKIKKDEVLTFKLVTGEEIIGKVSFVGRPGNEMTSIENVVIKAPRLVQLVPTAQGLQVSLVSWLPSIEDQATMDGEADIDGAALIAVAQPVKYIRDMWEQSLVPMSQGVSVPNQQTSPISGSTTDSSGIIL